jgi:hypothetical protein
VFWCALKRIEVLQSRQQVQQLQQLQHANYLTQLQAGGTAAVVRFGVLCVLRFSVL